MQTFLCMYPRASTASDCDVYSTLGNRPNTQSCHCNLTAFSELSNVMFNAMACITTMRRNGGEAIYVEGLRSNFAEGTSRWAVRRAQWLALGLTDEDMVKPKIAIVNSSSDLGICFSHLDAIVPVLKAAIRAAGGVGFEVRTTAPVDFVTSAGAGGRYVLPSRDLIVNDIETAVEGALLDGMICLASCDKTTPAQIMAAVRMNLPTIVVPCGYQRNAAHEDGGDDIEDVFLYAGHTALGRETVDELRDRSQAAIRGPGVCVGLGTANSMHIAAEALGMTLSGTTPLRANGTTMWDAVHHAGRQIITLVEKDIRPRSIVTEGAVANAVSAMLAIGGSINSVKHLQAICMEAELDVDVWGMFEKLADRVPVVCSVRPNGPHLIEDLDDAGGTLGVLTQLRTLLDLDAQTVNNEPLHALLDKARSPDDTVIRSVNDPYTRDPSIVIVRGSLTTDGAIVKLPVDGKPSPRFVGPAKVFASREGGLAALSAGQIDPGDVLVLRGIGVQGGPGMGMASALVFALDGAGLGDRCAVVTDGQLSGLVNKGIVVGEVNPEAATGGPIGKVRDGDRIEIDLDKRTVDLLVDPDELAERPDFIPDRTFRSPNGWLTQYAACAGPLSCGAALTTVCGATS